MKNIQSLLVPFLIFGFSSSAPALPDLVSEASFSNPYLSVEDFASTSCAVQEGCTTEGRRRVLRLNAYTKNIGPDNLVVGNPVGNPLFHFHECHGHYHFEDYLSFALKTSTGTIVASSKHSFCLLDSVRHDVNSSPFPLFNCSNQGIQAGWGDIYFANLDCQYIDITGVAAGTYTLEMHVNPANILPEGNYNNNVSTTSVTIPADVGPPVNDACSSATEILLTGVPQVGSTVAATNDGQGCGSSSSAKDAWFRFVPTASGLTNFALCGSSYSTVLSLHSGCPGLLANMLACSTQSTGPNCAGTQQSEINYNVVAGTTYLVRISGFSGLNGDYRLTVTGPAGTAGVGNWKGY